VQGPDALDKVPYMPSDKVIHLHQTNPDRRQKFVRTLEEEEDENRKKRKGQPQDEVELKTESETTHDQSEADDGTAKKTEDDIADSDHDTNSDKHIDVKA
jgi:hypothetical protein